MCVFGRPIKDFILILPVCYRPHDTWSDTLLSREDTLRNRHMKSAELLAEHTKHLPPQVVGDLVRIQNQTGLQPLKCDKNGQVIEVWQFNQRVDGSGRVTLRNRKFFQTYVPIYTLSDKLTIDSDLLLWQKPSTQATPMFCLHATTTTKQPHDSVLPNHKQHLLPPCQHRCMTCILREVNQIYKNSMLAPSSDVHHYKYRVSRHHLWSCQLRQPITNNSLPAELWHQGARIERNELWLKDYVQTVGAEWSPD